MFDEATIRDSDPLYEQVADELRHVLAFNRDHSLSNYYLAQLYEMGKGTDQDYKAALKHLQIAVDSDPNNDRAIYRLGKFYLEGHAMTMPDRRKAFELFNQASAKNNSDANVEIG